MRRTRRRVTRRRLTKRQRKLDKNKNGRIDAGDFRIMRKKRGVAKKKDRK